MSIASEITRIDNAKASLKASLEAKGATVSDDAKIDAYPSILDDIPVCTLQDKEVSVSGGTTLIEPDQGYTGLHSVSVTAEGGGASDVVFFYDYEGTLVESYTGAEIQALNALPNAPDHSQDEVPLTFDEWNWTLAQIKAYNTSYPDAIINVGANYHPTDNKAHFIFNITRDGDGTGVEIGLSNTSPTSTVDWGDGSTPEVISGKTLSHIYTTHGEYVCTVDSNTTSYNAGGDGKRNKLIKAFLPNTITLFSFTSCDLLQSIVIPSGITEIGSSLAYCSSLQSITIPSSVTTIASNGFNQNYSIKVISIPDTLTSIGTYVFAQCYSIKSMTIPEGMTSISQNAFDNCRGLLSLIIPSNITQIDNYAFNNCYSLTSIKLPNTLTTLGEYVFYYCYSLNSLQMSNGIVSIGNGAFAYCASLKSITLPDTLTSLGSSVFTYCTSLETITLSNSLTTIKNGLFKTCYALKSVTIPSSVTTFGSSVFYDCRSIQSISLPNTITSLSSGNICYNCCSAKSIVFPTNATSIESNALNGCHSLQSFVIPDNITQIGNSAFQYCSSLQSLTIPNTVTSIGSRAFDNCYSLYSITLLPTTPPTLANVNAINTSYTKKIYVPYSSDHSVLAAYQADSNWSNFVSVLEELPE